MPLKDLLIVENGRRLNRDHFPEDTDGRAVAIVDILEVHDWKEEELHLACASYWEAGWLSWALENVRSIKTHYVVPAKLGIYEIKLDNPELEIQLEN
ncbi:MAG: ASCH domain-containing protein [Verrucomicrobiota bacterium]